MSEPSRRVEREVLGDEPSPLFARAYRAGILWTLAQMSAVCDEESAWVCAANIAAMVEGLGETNAPEPR